MRRIVVGLALGVAVLGAVPAVTSAATVGESGGALRYSADRGETNWLLLRSEGHDTIRCGAGQDSVLADRHDEVARDCEVVGRPYCQEMGGYCTGGYRYLGSSGADRIRPDPFVDRVFAWGRGGDDRITSGADTADLHGEGGDDVLRAQDGNHYYPDTIHCGTGHDVAYADPWDTVAKDCETVHRAAAR